MRKAMSPNNPPFRDEELNQMGTYLYFPEKEDEEINEEENESENEEEE